MAVGVDFHILHLFGDAQRGHVFEQNRAHAVVAQHDVLEVVEFVQSGVGEGEVEPPVVVEVAVGSDEPCLPGGGSDELGRDAERRHFFFVQFDVVLLLLAALHLHAVGAFDLGEKRLDGEHR